MECVCCGGLLLQLLLLLPAREIGVQGNDKLEAFVRCDVSLGPPVCIVQRLTRKCTFDLLLPHCCRSSCLSVWRLAVAGGRLHAGAVVFGLPYVCLVVWWDISMAVGLAALFRAGGMFTSHGMLCLEHGGLGDGGGIPAWLEVMYLLADRL
jgi:hypothetical protein